jgi:hypothetical protein
VSDDDGALISKPLPGQHACAYCGCRTREAGYWSDADFRRLFTLQQQARDLGRDIITGGHGLHGSWYGAVTATRPAGSRVTRRDSWRCHHGHPDQLAALECALGEVRRLAAGGASAPCTAGPGCQEDELCRQGWARLAQDSAS